MGNEIQHIVWDWNGTLLSDNHAVIAAVNRVYFTFKAEECAQTCPHEVCTTPSNGALLTEDRAVLEAVNTVCEAFDRTPIDLEYWRAIFSRPLQACYERLLERPLDAEDWARIDALYHDTYRELLHTCGLAAGVPERLHAWAEAGGSQSLLSMWFHEELVPLVGEFGLSELFDRIDGLPERVGGGSKASYLRRHLERLDRKPHEAVLIGDVVDDAEAAAQVGAHCVLVTTGVMSRESLVETGAPVCDSVDEAVARIAARTG